MDIRILSQINEIRKKVKARDAFRIDDDDWVTINGTHVLLNEEGEAISGGKLKGMKFSNAKSSKKTEGEPVKIHHFGDFDKKYMSKYGDTISFKDENGENHTYMFVGKIDLGQKGNKRGWKYPSYVEIKDGEIVDGQPTKAYKIKEKLGKTRDSNGDMSFQFYNKGEDSPKYINPVDDDTVKIKNLKSPEECKTSQEVSDYLAAKGYFKGTQVNLDKLGYDNAVKVAKRIEAIHEDYPFLNQKIKGLRYKELDDNVYASVDPGKQEIKFNTKFFGPKGKNASEAYERDVHSKYHPTGTHVEAIIDHEYTHFIENMLNKKLGGKRAADIVMEKTARRLFGYPEDKKVSLWEEANVRAFISRYSCDNDGVNTNGTVKNELYGRNTEFLAEAVAGARCSDKPNRAMKIAYEEFNKLVEEYLK